MKSKVETSVKVVLELEPHEAAWLKGVMQNPLHGQSPGEESKEDAKMRLAFFEAISPVNRFS